MVYRSCIYSRTSSCTPGLSSSSKVSSWNFLSWSSLGERRTLLSSRLPRRDYHHQYQPIKRRMLTTTIYPSYRCWMTTTTSSSTSTPSPPLPDDESKETTTATAATTTTRRNTIVFPWRHEEQPLPRWIEGTEEYKRQGHMIYSMYVNKGKNNNDTNNNNNNSMMGRSDDGLGNAQMNMFVTAYIFLDVPLFRMIFSFGSWKTELAENISWAFTRGVAGLLLHLTTSTTATATTTVSAPSSSTTTNTNTTIDSLVNSETSELNFHAIVGGISLPVMVSSETNEEKKELPILMEEREQQRILRSTLHSKVVDLYSYKGTKADASTQHQEGPQGIPETEICLKTYPYSAELVSLYAIPYISRENIQRDKDLLTFYRNLMSLPPGERPKELNKLRKDKLETGLMESTVIAQVMIWCNEVFFIKDVLTGQVLQGSDDPNEPPKNVCHLVRMESRVRTTKDSKGTFQHIQDDWIITDIDDHLNGNLIL